MATKTKYELKLGVATREAFGKALVELGRQNQDVVVCDADLSKSTFTNLFQKEFPEAMPPWMAHTRMRTVIWAAFFLVTLIILPVLLAIVLPRLP